MPPPKGRVELVVTDHVDYSNGLATPFPRNRITIYAQPPAAEPTLAYTDDWLQLLTIHELAHIFHLNDSRGVWTWLQHIFGRDATYFPQVNTPGWIVEGLATYLETRLSTGGRARSPMYDMMLRAAILEDALFSIDRATIDPARWPTGNTRYLYGSLLFSYLADQHGPDAVTRFIRGYSGQLIPYRLQAAARRAFGENFTRNWELWQDSLRGHYEALADSIRSEGVTEPELLTKAGRYAAYPRLSSGGARVVYAVNNGREDVGHEIIAIGGARIALRRRSTLGPASWIPGSFDLVFAQADFNDPYTLHSDLYLEDSRGRIARITNNARVSEPDAHPDGKSAIAVQSAGGANALVRIDLSTGAVRELVEPDFDRYWSTPRFSPEGDRIAASLWHADGRVDVVVLDTLGTIVMDVTRGPAVDSDPEWSADGRFVLFSSDMSGVPNLYARNLETGALLQVTNVLTGAFQPDVSGDGRWIVFTYYLADGYHVARIPYDPSTWREVIEDAEAEDAGEQVDIEQAADSVSATAVPVAEAGPSQGAAPDDEAATADAALTEVPTSDAEGDAIPSTDRDLATDPETDVGGPSRPYSPFRTLLPTYWSVLLEQDDDLTVGVALSGEDVIERHTWAAQAIVYPEDGRLGGSAGYRYAGLGNPLLEFATRQVWSLEAVGSGPGGDLLRRTREGSLTVTLLRRRWDASTTLQTGADVSDVDFLRRNNLDEVDRELPVDVGAFVGAGYSTARGYGLSIGLQEGFTTSARMQVRRYIDAPEGPDDSHGYWRFTSRSRAFHAFDWFGFAPPTLATRFDFGVESTSSGPGFSVGGTSGGTSVLPYQPSYFGRAIGYPVRGYEPGTQRGNRVFSASAEYRFPIALVERGLGLLPLGIDRVTGDFFVDVGAAWCDGRCSTPRSRTPTAIDPLGSAGAEIIVTFRTGFFSDLPFRFGVAAPFSGDRASFYVRTVPSF